MLRCEHAYSFQSEVCSLNPPQAAEGARPALVRGAGGARGHRLSLGVRLRPRAGGGEPVLHRTRHGELHGQPGCIRHPDLRALHPGRSDLLPNGRHVRRALLERLWACTACVLRRRQRLFELDGLLQRALFKRDLPREHRMQDGWPVYGARRLLLRPMRPGRPLPAPDVRRLRYRVCRDVTMLFRDLRGERALSGRLYRRGSVLHPRRAVLLEGVRRDGGLLRALMAGDSPGRALCSANVAAARGHDTGRP